MKKILSLIVIVLSSLTLTGSTLAATSTSSADQTTPAPSTANQINELKERLATKVAELRRSEKRAIFGTVKSTSISSFTLETSTKNIKIELTDDLKVIQYLKGKRTRLTTEDVSRGDIVTVFGDYDATVDLLAAKIVFIQAALPLRLIGTVTQADKANYTLTLASVEGQSYLVDIETDTKTVSWSPDLGMAKSGFSKMNIGDSIEVIALAEPKQTNRVSARRILNLGNLSGTAPTPTPALPAESPAGKTTPSATPSATPKS